ncbi:MAG TPA: DUF1330 domain-containing protein [Dongiaceae bacterium]|nr:DUF1330 domain-containing protein [Dongiaceae bacterium]
MPKGYWVAFYRAVHDPAALAEYGKLATKAIEAGGGNFLARGVPARAYEAGLKERAVVIEFPSLQAAVATFEGPDYQAAAQIIHGKVERDIRFIEGA